MAESIRDQIRTPAEDPLDSKLSRDLLRQFRSGTLVRLRRASYIAQSTWLSMDEIPRHLARMHAIDAAANSRPVFAAESAALLWGLPVQSIPERVQINVPPGSGQRSRGPAVRRQFPQLDDGEWFVDGLKVTSAVQTAVAVTECDERILTAILATYRTLDGVPLDEALTTERRRGFAVQVDAGAVEERRAGIISRGRDLTTG